MRASRQSSPLRRELLFIVVTPGCSFVQDWYLHLFRGDASRGNRQTLSRRRARGAWRQVKNDLCDPRCRQSIIAAYLIIWRMLLWMLCCFPYRPKRLPYNNNYELMKGHSTESTIVKCRAFRIYNPWQVCIVDTRRLGWKSIYWNWRRRDVNQETGIIGGGGSADKWSSE